ncbi:MAG: hypothetical protein KatS3mg124_1307 [Porticoccaceae bacterium]|nr:MAG: hypothetical protein KatS3mg124_1307 [Porticoccaceae bacterium]
MADSLQIRIEHLLALAVQGLDQALLRAPKARARRLYKELREGRTVDFGTLTASDRRFPPVRLKLALDHSQFVGFLTLPLFRQALADLLRGLATRLSRREEIRLFEAEGGGEVIAFVPGLVGDGHHLNVLVLGIVPGPSQAVLKLQFLDPDQFRRRDGESAAGAGPS